MTQTGHGERDGIGAAVETLSRLRATRPDLADSLLALVVAVADEALRTPRFASTLSAAITSEDARDKSPKRTGRRAPGVLDPFAAYAKTGEAGLRDQLGALELERLRDIVAEHGMDHDRLAMKWKDPSRVIDRIVDKVAARVAKGSAFRSE